jgi:site-specific recombinase XerD
MIELTYSGGLRCSEVLALKVNDIDFGRSVITIRNGKGRKDRAVMLADSLIDTLKQYLNTYMPKEYLYEGATSGQYSVSSLRNILAKAVSLAGITKHVTLHTLRHSFATHLLENGTDIRYIQNLLGHSDIKTTTLYTKVAKTQILKIKSPLDIMREQQLNKKR